MTIVIYTPSNFVTIYASNRTYRGHWVTGDPIIAKATELNCMILITEALKLPVTRLSLEC